MLAQIKTRSLPGRYRKWALALIIVAIGIGFFAVRAWQGPVVQASQVVKRPLIQQVVATGRIVAESRVQVGSELTSVVTDRLVREGDRVVAGQVLLRLRDDEYLARQQEALAALTQLEEIRRPQAMAALNQAEAQLAQARREVQRREKLVAANATPREDKERAEQALAVALAAAEQARVDSTSLSPGQTEEVLLQARLDAAEAALSKTVVRAQFPGTILTRHVEQGDVVQPGQVLFEIARDDDIEILVPVDERNLGLLRVGQQAVCIADAYPQESFSAVVQRIAPTVDAERGTVDVRLAVTTIPEYVRNDLTVTATIETASLPSALTVPNEALFNRSSAQASVWRIRNGVAIEARVDLGLRGATMTQVVSGLEEGDWVSTSADLAQGQRVRIADHTSNTASSPAGATKELPFKL
ncbi:MAG: efflux RND transporter periplasmic adaptor subunit [Candidimonas sp.]|nr:efflux RND transporter periplasmic adaptor subunit [Candidimonas sp.]